MSGGDGADQVGINPCNSEYTSLFIISVLLRNRICGVLASNTPSVGSSLYDFHEKCWKGK